ncbi:MAG: hypothetical protein ACFB15_31470 [Cyclobacteriaceae bacterium]
MNDPKAPPLLQEETSKVDVGSLLENNDYAPYGFCDPFLGFVYFPVEHYDELVSDMKQGGISLIGWLKKRYKSFFGKK